MFLKFEYGKCATGDVILVGHSWGGFVIGEAGVSSKLKALVYIAAVVPDKGESFIKRQSTCYRLKQILTKY